MKQQKWYSKLFSQKGTFKISSYVWGNENVLELVRGDGCITL